MESKVYNCWVNVNWELISLMSVIDRFDASWSALERQENKNLKQLKTVATIRSVGASTRIEGSKLTDEEVDTLLQNIDISKLEDRDAQEVVGYFETLDLIADACNDIHISNGDIKNLHATLLKYSEKDKWHKGNYKIHSNAVEAKYADGTSKIIFSTTAPGFETETAMNNLIDWYNNDTDIHPLVKCSIFAYEFLSIHPFQDGNGRLSRLLSALLLLKNGYKWIQYISFESEIENRKLEYYKVLRSCQAERPNENASEWVNFFFSALANIQQLLLQKLQLFKIEGVQLLPKERQVISFIQNNAGCKSGEIVKGLGLSRMVVIRMLNTLIERDIIEKHGTGSATQYTIL
jgi:Fic family protein